MLEIDKEVLTQVVASTVEFHKKSHPTGFYDAGSIVQPYHIFLQAKQDKQDQEDKQNGKKVKPRKRSSITVTEIHRELERMIKTKELSSEFSWLDPRVTEAREQRIKEQQERQGF